MLDGHFDWAESTADEGPFNVEWLPGDEAKRIRRELNITTESF